MTKEKAKTKVAKVVKQQEIDDIWSVIEEIQNNLDFLNDKVQRILNRLGLE